MNCDKDLVSCRGCLWISLPCNHPCLPRCKSVKEAIEGCDIPERIQESLTSQSSQLCCTLRLKAYMHTQTHVQVCRYVLYIYIANIYIYIYSIIYKYIILYCIILYHVYIYICVPGSGRPARGQGPPCGCELVGLGRGATSGIQPNCRFYQREQYKSK